MSNSENNFQRSIPKIGHNKYHKWHRPSLSHWYLQPLKCSRALNEAYFKLFERLYNECTVIFIQTNSLFITADVITTNKHIK